MEISVEYEGQKYNFVADKDGNKVWIFAQGKRINLVVPKTLSHELRNFAVQNGYSEDFFISKKQKKVRQRKEKVTSAIEEILPKKAKSDTRVMLGKNK